MPAKADIVPLERIEGLVYLVRGQKVMLDADLAALYGVETKALNQAVRRNQERFPDDFAFQLSPEESRLLQPLRSQIVTLKRGQHRKYLPCAFTEQGDAMLSSVVRSPRAVRVNIEIMRAFVQLRKLLASNAGLARRLDELEKKHDAQFKVVFEAIRQLMTGRESGNPDHQREIGFHTLHESDDASPPLRKRRIGRVRY